MDRADGDVVAYQLGFSVTYQGWQLAKPGQVQIFPMEP